MASIEVILSLLHLNFSQQLRRCLMIILFLALVPFCSACAILVEGIKETNWVK